MARLPTYVSNVEDTLDPILRAKLGTSTAPDRTREKNNKYKFSKKKGQEKRS